MLIRPELQAFRQSHRAKSAVARKTEKPIAVSSRPPQREGHATALAEYARFSGDGNLFDD
jgi:hypothetical protein